MHLLNCLLKFFTFDNNFNFFFVHFHSLFMLLMYLLIFGMLILYTKNFQQSTLLKKSQVLSYLHPSQLLFVLFLQYLLIFRISPFSSIIFILFSPLVFLMKLILEKSIYSRGGPVCPPFYISPRREDAKDFI